VRRVALFVAANDGGAERETLLYAGSDAEALAKALTELGGLARGDITILADPDVDALERALTQVTKTVAKLDQAGERVQLVFYYSGHSDETGLLLGGVHFDYKRLRKRLDAIPADVRIGILDSCSSGAFTRAKGGKKRAPFLVGAAAEVEGHAYLTSSSADEAAQESDRIGGSFFTHFLVTGLRGAADFDGDRRVTLGEAYQFAFDETLARTEATSGGPQHAAYDIGLAGTGDLVMTDLRKTSAKLEIDADLVGRIYVRDRRGNLAAELFKPKGAGPITLALEPGDYTVTIDDGRQLHRAELAVRSNKTEHLSLGGLENIAIEDTRGRGGASDEPEPSFDEEGYELVPFNIGVAPGAELNAGHAGPLINYFSVSIGLTGVARVRGVQGAVLGAWTDEELKGVQGAIGAAITHGPGRGLQAAIGATLAHRDFRGLQSALAYTHTRDALTGVQIGAVNTAGSVQGMQIGLVNIGRGRVRGVQVGLINYADEADASIALLPITRKGGVWVDLWTSDVALVHAAVRFRAKRTYSFLTGAVHPLGDLHTRSWSAGFGFGGPLVWRERFSLELDNAISLVAPDYSLQAPHALDTLRLTAAWRPARHFALWGGVTANLLVDPLGEGDGFRPGYSYGTLVADPAEASVGLRVWPGFAAGFEF
jgi:hypothetical protein